MDRYAEAVPGGFGAASAPAAARRVAELATTTTFPRRAGFLRSLLFRQVIFASIATLAGATGMVLLAIPGSTASFFSWGLTPAPVAALIGGLYVGSASTFALGARTLRTSGRGLCLMSVVFTAPTLVITLVHLGVFDFGRWQAWL